MSEASYVCNLSGQKFITNAKNGQFDDCLGKLKVAVKQCYQTGRKLVENAKIKKNLKCDHLGDFQTMWHKIDLNF